jgi:cysteine-rich repeat protein
MRRVLILALLLAARLATGGCLDDCREEWGGSGPDWEECVADCGVCGNGELEGDEECDDGNLVGGDCCDAACRPEPAGTPCRDDEDPTDEDLCTTPVCDGDGECEREDQPAQDCLWPAREGASTLRVRDVDDDTKDRLVWTWRRGATAALGDPTSATAYALCLYDETGTVATLVVPAGGECGAHPCWTQASGGFRYRNRTGEPDGAISLRLRRGRGAFRLEAAGENLFLPDLSTLGSPLTVQLRRSGSAACWSAQYTVPTARKRAARRLRRRSDPPPPRATTSTTVTTTTATTTIPPGGGTSTTTIPGARGATVEVTVLDPGGAPVADADVTIDYGGAAPEVFDVTDEAGIVVFTGEPIALPATITAEDLDDRTGTSSSAGFAAGVNRVTVTVR